MVLNGEQSYKLWQFDAPKFKNYGSLESKKSVIYGSLRDDFFKNYGSLLLFICNFAPKIKHS
jgi:hypothetical protein